MSNPTQREAWIDVAKVLTMILVIIGHSTYYAIKSGYGGYDPFKGLVLSHSVFSLLASLVVSFIYAFHMPFFMAISGMTLAISYKPMQPLAEISRKRAKRLLIPFLTVSIFLLIPLKYLTGYWDDSDHILLDMFSGQILLLGNNHLWFVVSLFLIIIAYIWLMRHGYNSGWLFWSFCVIATIIGERIGMTRLGGFFGITGCLKFFLYFALGFSLWERIKTFNLKTSWLLASWVMMGLAFGAKMISAQSTPPFISKLLPLPLAIWGCINMIATAKAVARWSAFTNHPFIRTMNAHCYDLYLYSDPFNYVLISILVAIFGSTIITANAPAAIALIVRIFGSLGCAFFVVYFMQGVSAIAKRIGRKSPQRS